MTNALESVRDEMGQSPIRELPTFKPNQLVDPLLPKTPSTLHANKECPK